MTLITNTNLTSAKQHCAHKAGISDHKNLIPRSNQTPDIESIKLYSKARSLFNRPL